MLFQEDFEDPRIALCAALPYPSIPDCFSQLLLNPFQKQMPPLKRSLQT
jgi:hypothetical protein